MSQTTPEITGWERLFAGAPCSFRAFFEARKRSRPNYGLWRPHVPCRASMLLA